MDNIDLKISEEINTEQKPKEKGMYRKLEDCYYNTLDKINKVFPIYKIIDPIDKVVPSFIIVNIFFLLFIAAIIVVIVLLLNTSAMKVNFDFYYDNARVNENLLVNISYADFNKNFDTDKNSLTIKLKKDLEIKLKVLSEGYEFERSYPIVENYIKVNIPKKEIIDTTPKKISIFAYEYPNKTSIYNSNIMLSLRCLSSGKTENISLSGLKEYEKAYDCGNIRFTGNVLGFNPIDSTCSNNETSCAIPLVTFTDRTPEEENLTPKNNLNVYVTDENKNILENVVVKLYKIDSTISVDKNTDLFGKVTYLNLDVGQYKLQLQYDYNGTNYSVEDKNVYIVTQATDIRKDYVIKLAKDGELEATLKLKINTFDGNEIDFRINIYDINGDLSFSRSGETPESYSTNLLKGDYFLTVIPEDEYNPEYLEKISLTQDLNVNVILTAYDATNYFRLGVRVKDDKNNFVNNALVSVRNKDNNNLIYFEKNTNKAGLAEFTLPKTNDYAVFARKNAFFGSGVFEKKNIVNGIGGLTIKITRENKSVPFTFTLDNRNIDYKVYLDYSDENAFFEGNGKINLSVIPDRKFDLSVIVDTGFDVYTYLVTPLMVPLAESYNLKYNYDSDLNVKATDLKLDYMLSKDVNDLNLFVEKNYYFGMETKLNCNDEKGIASTNYALSNTNAFKFGKSLVYGRNNYVNVTPEKINYLVGDDDNPLICSDDVRNYHYMFNTTFDLNTLDKDNIEGNLIYDNKTLSQISPKLNFKIGFNPVCDIRADYYVNDTTIQEILIDSFSNPIIIPALLGYLDVGVKLTFGYNCFRYSDNKSIRINDDTLLWPKYVYNILDYGIYNLNYGKDVNIAVLENYNLGLAFLEALSFTSESTSGRLDYRINTNYSKNINCYYDFCSLQQYLVNKNSYSGSYVNILYDYFESYFDPNTIKYFPNRYLDKNTGLVSAPISKLQYPHVFYYIPYREATLFSDNNKFGTCVNSGLLYWNDSLEAVPFCNDGNYTMHLDLTSVNEPFPYVFSATGNLSDLSDFNETIDIKLSKGFLIKVCDNVSNCYSKTAQYYFWDTRYNTIYLPNVILDINNSLEKLTYKLGTSELQKYLKLLVIESDMDKYDSTWLKYDLSSLQAIIDFYNSTYVRVFGPIYFWYLNKIIEDLIAKGY